MSEETNRREFEEWITAMPYERDITRRPNDFEKYAFPNTYVDYQVDLAWEAWQAARAKQSEIICRKCGLREERGEKPNFDF